MFLCPRCRAGLCGANFDVTGSVKADSMPSVSYWALRRASPSTPTSKRDCFYALGVRLGSVKDSTGMHWTCGFGVRCAILAGTAPFGNAFGPVCGYMPADQHVQVRQPRPSGSCGTSSVPARLRTTCTYPSGRGSSGFGRRSGNCGTTAAVTRSIPVAGRRHLQRTGWRRRADS
jgi:hypothetical protein